jgi:hypothetical protein
MVDLEELDDELLGQSTKSKYAQAAEEMPQVSKYAPPI